MNITKICAAVLSMALITGTAFTNIVFAEDYSSYDSDTHTLTLAGDVNRNTIMEQLSGVSGEVNVRVSADGAYITDPDRLFMEKNSQNYYFVDIDLTNATMNPDKRYAQDIFRNCTRLESIDLGSLDMSNIVDMDGMFLNCESLTYLDLGEEFDTSGAEDLRNMFRGCTSIKMIDLGDKFNTANVKHMSSMFADCKSLKEIKFGDLFVTDSLINMTYMFQNCSSLEEIKVSRDWSLDSIDNDNAMYCVFDGCVNLKGGCGTAYAPENISGRYAHIDGGSANPGYLTSSIANIVAGYQVSLDGEVGVDFYFALSGSFEDSDESHLKITVPGENDRTVYIKDLPSPEPVEGYDDVYYKTTISLAAKKMRDNVKITFYGDNSETVKVADYNFSVEDYARALLNGDYSSNVKQFVGKMMAYGIYTEQYFGYGEGTSAVADDWSSDVGAVENISSIDLDALRRSLEMMGMDSYDVSSLDGTAIILEGTSLVLKSATKLKLYFKSSEPVTASCNGKQLEVTRPGEYYVVSMEGITAENLRFRYDISINGHTIYVFPLTYCYKVLFGKQNKTYGSLEKLMIAMLMYDSAAQTL